MPVIVPLQTCKI